MRTPLKYFLMVALTILVIVLGNEAWAGGTTNTWDGSASTDWHTAANWSTNTVPVSGTHNVVIPAGLSNYPVLSADGSCRTLASLADGASLSGTGTLTIGTAGTVTTTGTASISCPLTFNVATSFTETNASDQLTISGVISGTGAITKAGSGTLILAGDNSYSGLTTISAGTLKLGANGGGTSGPLGTTAASTVVSNGATFDLNGFTLGTAEAISLRGTGVSNAGALTNTGGNASYSGAISLAGATTIIANTSGTLTLSGNCSGNQALTLDGDGTGTYSGIRSGNGTIVKTGTGIWTLSGDNTYTGLTTISAGTLKLGANGGAVNTPLGTTTAGTTVASGATLDLNGFTLGTAEAITSLAGTGVSGGGALTNTGTDASFSGNITLITPGATIAATNSGIFSLSGNIIGDFPLTLDGNGIGSYSGVRSGTSTVIKLGTGTWTLSGLNTYTGTTTVTGGFLRAENNTVVASTNGPFGNNASGLNLNGGTIQSNLATFSRPLTVTATDSGLDAYGSARTISSAITLATAGTFNLNIGGTTVASAAGQELTISGIISNTSGTLGLTKIGTSTVILSGINTYTGSTTVNAGILRANTTNIVASTNGPFGNNASGLNLNGGTIQSDVATFSRPITVTATNSGIDAYGSSRTISSAIDNASGSTFNLNIGGTTAAGAEGQDLTLSGVISNSSGTLGLTKIGTSKVIITGTNTFTGGVTLNAGTLNIDNNQALGTSAGTFTIAGGTIDASTAGISTLNYPLALNADFTFTGTNSLNLGAGAISMNADRQITTTANTLTLGGTISQATRTLTKAGAGTLSFGSNTVTLNGLNISAGTLTSTSGTMNLAGNFSNGGTFTHNGGTVNFNGSGSQTITGATTFSTLKINNASGLTLVNAITVSTLTIGDVTSNSIFNDGGFQLTSTGTLNLTSGTFKLGGSGTATIFPAFATRNISTGTTIEYASGVAQTVSVLPGYQNLTYSGAGAKTVAAGGTLSVAGNFSTSGGTATFTTTANATVTGNIIGTGAITMGSGTLTVSGNWTNNGTFTAGTGTVNYNGSSQTIAPLTYNNLTISQSGGNASLSGNATVNGILNLSSGNLVVTDPYALTMGGSATTIGAKDVTGIVKRTSLVAGTEYTFGNQYTTIIFRNAGTLPTEVSVKISIGSAPSWKTGAVQRTYDFIRNGGSGSYASISLHYLDAELNGNTENTLVLWHLHTNSDVEEHGRSNYNTTDNWVKQSSFNASFLPTAFGSAAWTLANTALSSSTWTGSIDTDWSNPGNWTPPGVPSDLTDVIIPDASTTPNDPTLGLSIAIKRLTINSGGILNSAATSTLTISGANGAWSNNGGTFNASTSTVIFTNAAATLSGITDFYNLTINSGALLRISNGSTMRIGGTMTNNGTWSAALEADVTVEYNGGSQTVLNPNGATPGYRNLVLSGTGTKTMPGTTLSISGNFSMSGTASATASAAINTTGNFTIGSGTSFTAGSFTHTIGGNFSNTGTFTGTGSTFNFNGAAQAINNANTWYNLSITGTSARTVTFQSGLAQTVSNSLTLTGASGQLLTLAPSASPTKWQINAPATQSVSYVSASYSDAIGGTAISADNGTNINGGNTINWTFSAQTTPTFSPAAGAIAFGTTVTISSVGADAIYYTTDGSDPTTASTNQATTPLVINSAVTVKALAVKAGSPNSAVGSAAYTQAASADLTGLVLSGSPSNYTFASGTYTYNGVTVLNGVSSVTITPTGAGAITVDGTTVSSGSASAAISLTAGVQKAIVIVATETGKSAKTYTINVTRNNITPTPTFSPVAGTIAFGTTVTISSTGADAVYYTTDGSDPTTASTNQATTPLVINSAVTVKALAVKAGWDNSTIGSAAYTQATSANLTGLALSGSPSNYTFASGTYTYNGVRVLNAVSSITVTPTGAGTITVDGTTLSSGSASAAISLTAGVQKAIVIVATETGKSAKTYTINVTRNDAPQATPTFDPVAGAITFGFTVAITSTGADAIYYTTDGSDPTTASTLYAAPVAINSALTLKALAVKAGLDNSAIGSAAYTQAASADLTSIVLSGSPSNYTFASGTYTYNGVRVLNAVSSITVTPTGAEAITVDGTIVSSETASAAIALTSGVQKAIVIVATETGKSDKTYTINVTRNGAPQATPTFSPVAGTIAFGTTVTISSTGADAVYYTTDGSDPTIASTLYAAPVAINSALTLKALAVKAGLDNSAIGSAAYTQAASANLTGLVLSGSPSNYTFASGTYTYNGVRVLNAVSSITVTPTGAGTITVDGTTLSSGSASAAISLTAGVQKAIVIVVTESGKSAKTYTINVTRVLDPAKAITAFTIMGNGTVNESAKTIAVTVPYGTNVTALVASFTTTGASVKVGGVTQTSGTTANNFSSLVTYTVTAADATTQDYVVTVTVAANPAKAITAFLILGNGTVNESAKTIAVTVPYGTDLTALVTSFSTSGASVKVAGVTQSSGITANNFSSPLTYTVTAADATTQDYVVTVTVAANPAKAITAFTILGNGTVNESAKTIAVTVPYGTNVTALVASFTTTGASVKVGGVTQTSGTTANNFSSPLTYTVTAADASTQDYVVTVTVALNPAKAITAFTILGNGTVNEGAKTIAVSVPYGTDVSALVASFTTTGASLKVGAITQTSGATANNFSSPVTYTVTAADATTQDYVITVTVAANPAKAITAFTILGNGTVNESAKTIAVTVPYGTNVTALVASFTTTGASVKVGGVTQTSGTTANNFSSPVTYTVTAADASTQDYAVTVTVAANTSKAITAFTILGNGTVNESTKTIAVIVPYDTDVTTLVASFTTTGASLKVGVTTQTSGATANNFSSPVTYTVTAADASTQDYVVTVTVAANPAKAITAFTILGSGTVNESAKTIAVTVPYGTSLTALVATFTTSGASVTVSGTLQSSGTTANNFSSTVTYTVTAADASTQDYVVSVTVAANPAKAITAFTILGNGTVNEGAKTIAVSVPYGTDVSALVASFTTTGASLKVGAITQTSGATANNFSSPVTYTVTAADATTQDYVITVTVAANPAKAITAFTILGNGSVNESAKTIAVTLPYGTNVTALVASFTTTGASVKVGGVTQTSGTTANNFSSLVTYTVTAADATTQDYVVTVTVAANPAKAITAFLILGDGTVNEGDKTITVTVPCGTDVTALVATFTTTGASVKVGSTTQVSGTTANDFTSPVTYTVTAADASTQNYVVSVIVLADPSKAITAFTILSNGTVNESGKTIAVTVPYGTNLTSLVANFSITGVSVKVGSTEQTSGTTANNFSSPVTYTVTAADATTQDYVVTVTVALNPAKAITAFTILGNGTINEGAKTIAVSVPYGTSVTALVATFTTSGASVKVGSTTQVSGTTANNFSSPVTYTVTAADATTQDYVVSVTVAANPAKAITTFTILGNGTVNESAKTIAVILPFGTNVTALAASFSTTGASLKVGSVTQTSGTTANDFSSPVTYTVTAADASIQDYVVTVTVAANPAKAITAFTILGNGTVNEGAKTIALTVPFGTDISALVATFTTSGTNVKIGTANQTSGTTANNFSSPVTYTVTAADATTVNYLVTVSVASNTSKALTAFTILGNGTVNESAKTIAVTVPYGTNLSSLVATFNTSGASVKVAGLTQVSGTTANNFSSPLTYTVTAADASTQNYVVRVTVAENFAKAFTAFSILGSGTVSESAKTIVVTLPYGTAVTALVATFNTTGTSVKVKGLMQTSGVSVNNFSSVVTYTVTAADASTQDYVVTVNVAQNSAKAITAFSIQGNGTVNESAKTIAVSVPSDTDLTSLVASFTTTGASVKVGATSQISGTTANDFTSPVTYTVIAADASTQNYVATVAVDSNLPGRLTAGTIGTDQITCEGFTIALTQITAATGGSGSYTYQWQKSILSSSTGFTDITGATGTAYAPGSLSITTWYRRMTSSPGFNSAPIPGNVVTITVVPPVSNNLIIAPAISNFCQSADPTTIIGNNPSGGSGNYTYQWKSAPYVGACASIPGATSKDYDPGVLTRTTNFRRDVISGDCVYSSNYIVITVTQPLINNIISGDQTITSDNKPEKLTGTGPEGGNSKISYLWESSTLSETSGFVPAAGINTKQNYSPDMLTQTTFFRRRVSSGICPITYSNLVKITLNILNHPPVVSNDSYILAMNTTLSVLGSEGLLLNDTDPDNNTLTATIVSPPANGTLILNYNGGFTYTPMGNFTGTDTFTYSACDNGTPEYCNIGTVTIHVTGNPPLGIAKTVSIPIRQLDGYDSNILTFKITVKNYGISALNNLRVSDELSKTFPFPTQFFLQGIPSTSKGILQTNTAFDGRGNIDLLQSNNILPGGESDTIKFTLKVSPDHYMMGPFYNSAGASATDRTGNLTKDISTEGTDPDPDNNGIPDEHNATRVMLVRTTVRIPEGFSPNGDGVNDMFVIENLDSEQISLQVFNSLGALVYKNINYKNDWAGLSNQRHYSGKEIPNGTYFYIVSKRNNMENYVSFITVTR